MADALGTSRGTVRSQAGMIGFSVPLAQQSPGTRYFVIGLVT